MMYLCMGTACRKKAEWRLYTSSPRPEDSSWTLCYDCCRIQTNWLDLTESPYWVVSMWAIEIQEEYDVQ